MKYLPSILSALLITFGMGVFIAHAEGYAPLAPLPGTFTGSSGQETTNLSTYLSGVIKLLIALGVGLSVLFAVIGGTQYVAASINPAAKAGALERIQNSIVGLILVLSSYLLLSIINPKLVAFELTLPPLSLDVYKDTGIVTGDQWGDDTAVRDALSKGTSIRFNKPNCLSINADNCTSVFGLNSKAIIGLRKLADNCTSWVTVGSCSITITGGTEYWLHKSHTTGTRVDLSQDVGTLNRYITKDGPSSVTSCGVSSDPHYMPAGPDGGIYVDEPNRDKAGNIAGTKRHWHVCYEL